MRLLIDNNDRRSSSGFGLQLRYTLRAVFDWAGRLRWVGRRQPAARHPVGQAVRESSSALFPLPFVALSRCATAIVRSLNSAAAATADDVGHDNFPVRRDQHGHGDWAGAGRLPDPPLRHGTGLHDRLRLLLRQVFHPLVRGGTPPLSQTNTPSCACRALPLAAACIKYRRTAIAARPARRSSSPAMGSTASAASPGPGRTRSSWTAWPASPGRSPEITGSAGETRQQHLKERRTFLF